MFDNRTILLFWLYNEQTFRMFSLRDLRFLLCSLELDVLRAQRIMGFYLDYPQINGVGKSDQMGNGGHAEEMPHNLTQLLFSASDYHIGPM